MFPDAATIKIDNAFYNESVTCSHVPWCSEDWQCTLQWFIDLFPCSLMQLRLTMYRTLQWITDLVPCSLMAWRGFILNFLTKPILLPPSICNTGDIHIYKDIDSNWIVASKNKNSQLIQILRAVKICKWWIKIYFSLVELEGSKFPLSLCGLYT